MRDMTPRDAYSFVPSQLSNSRKKVTRTCINVLGLMKTSDQIEDMYLVSLDTFLIKWFFKPD